MGFFEDISKAFGGSALVGLGVALVAPAILPALGTALRPLAKSAVKGGIVAYDRARELVAEAGEQMSDMVAEARSEMEVEGQEANAKSSGIVATGDERRPRSHEEKPHEEKKARG